MKKKIIRNQITIISFTFTHQSRLRVFVCRTSIRSSLFCLFFFLNIHAYGTMNTILSILEFSIQSNHQQQQQQKGTSVEKKTTLTLFLLLKKIKKVLPLPIHHALNPPPTTQKLFGK